MECSLQAFDAAEILFPLLNNGQRITQRAGRYDCFTQRSCIQISAPCQQNRTRPNISQGRRQKRPGFRRHTVLRRRGPALHHIATKESRRRHCDRIRTGFPIRACAQSGYTTGTKVPSPAEAETDEHNYRLMPDGSLLPATGRTSAPGTLPHHIWKIKAVASSPTTPLSRSYSPGTPPTGIKRTNYQIQRAEFCHPFASASCRNDNRQQATRHPSVDSICTFFGPF